MTLFEKGFLKGGIICSLCCLLVVIMAKGCTGPAEKGDRYYSIYFHQDATTGCQYVSGPGASGLSPRMDAEGKHVCTVTVTKEVKK